MGTRGRPKDLLELTDEERETLERWARRPSSTQSLAFRSKIVLKCADGVDNKTVAALLSTSAPTVGKWRSRFINDRLDGLSDEPRPGAVRKITDVQIEDLIDKTRFTKPVDASHWSCRSMSKQTGISSAQISRIWRDFGFKPHLSETFKLSPDEFFVDKVRDLTALYLNPPDAAMVICVDEKSQIQALDRTAPMFPMRPGVPERQTHDYKRNGTTNLYAALDIATGNVISRLTTRHRAIEFRKFLDLINNETPAHLDIHLVLDNVATHKTPAIQRWLTRHPRFHVHFTPTYSSWMNLVERWFAELTTKWLTRQTHHSANDLARSIRRWIKTWNDNPRPYIWHKNADEIFAAIARYIQPSSETGH